MVLIIMTVLFSCFIVAVVLRTAYRMFVMFVKKKYPDHSYTPFDYVSGQTETPFHEEEREEEEENDRTGQRYD